MKGPYLLNKLQSELSNKFFTFFDGDPTQGAKELCSRGSVTMALNETKTMFKNTKRISVTLTPGIARYWAIMTAKTGGQVMYYAPLENEMVAISNQTVNIQANNLIISEQ